VGERAAAVVEKDHSKGFRALDVSAAERMRAKGALHY
jgi:hypothetical protein